MAKIGEAYIDLRIKVTLETEEYGDAEGNTYSYTHIEEAEADVKKVKGVPDDALYSLYESFGQSDRWQLWLQDEIPSAIERYVGE